MMIAVFICALLGLVLYCALEGKVGRIGEIMFAFGLLVLLLACSHGWHPVFK